MMLAKTYTIGDTMDGYSQLSITRRKDIMVCWKIHEKVSQIVGKLGRDKSTISHKIRQ